MQQRVDRWMMQEHPSMEPLVRALKGVGVWSGGVRGAVFSFVWVAGVVFQVTQFVQLWMLRKAGRGGAALENLSVALLMFTEMIKLASLKGRAGDWLQLVREAGAAERAAGLRGGKDGTAVRKRTLRVRVLTALYTSCSMTTYLLYNAPPILGYILRTEERRAVQAGLREGPEIISSWFWFDSRHPPGLYIAFVTHVFFNLVLSTTFAAFDSLSVALLTFLLGLLPELADSCRKMYGDPERREDRPGPREIRRRLAACHAQHLFIVDYHLRLNGLLSPVMFLYFLVASVMMCTSAVLVALGRARGFQAVYLLVYSSSLFLEMIIFCWPATRLAEESEALPWSVYESRWWSRAARGSAARGALLLAGQLQKSLKMTAGPVIQLHVRAFLDSMKGVYSFYTLFTSQQKRTGS